MQGLDCVGAFRGHTEVPQPLREMDVVKLLAALDVIEVPSPSSSSSSSSSSAAALDEVKLGPKHRKAVSVEDACSIIKGHYNAQQVSAMLNDVKELYLSSQVSDVFGLPGTGLTPKPWCDVVLHGTTACRTG